MHIDHLEVANHRRIADLGIDIRGHAVIVGANDVGKTSLLRLLHLLLGASTGQLYQQLSLADLASTAEQMRVEAHLVDFTNDERALFHREISVDASDRAESLRVQLLVDADRDDPEAVVIQRWFPESGHERPPSREQLVGFGWKYLPATRGTSVAALDGPDSALQTLLGTIDLGTERPDLVRLMEEFNTRLAGSKPIDDLRDDVAGHLSKAMPRVIAKDDLAVRTVADPKADVLGDVSMFFKRDGQHVPLGEQSDGLRQLMSMTLFDLAVGAANVVAIDEPELHLHPSSQRTVAELFGSGPNQKILVTHSPYIVQRFEPAQVIAVSPDGECHQVAAERLSVVEKQRANWWSPRLLEALTARHVIVVEGVADRVIVEQVAQLMGLGLDRMSTVVLELDGADKFAHVYKLIGPAGFAVNVLGLVDDKEQGPWLGAFRGRPADVLGTKLWVSAPDLEGEYCEALTGPGAASALIAAGFCGERAVVASCGVGQLKDVTAAGVAAYCRNRKVDAAVAIASQLDARTAANIKSVHGLLSQLRAIGTA